MKLILAVLAISCTAFAMPQDVPPGASACLRQCVMQDKYRDWAAQALPKAQEFAKQLSEGTQPTLPIPLEKWDQYCTELGTIRTCMEACNDPIDAANKAKALTVVNGVAGIVCDTEIKPKLPCLLEVAKVASPTCNEQCRQFKQPFVDAYNTYKQEQPREVNWERAKTAGKNLCLFVNCRLKCRKSDIETKCQADGYAAAKKLAQKVATLGQTSHAQFRPAGNFPEECKPEKILEGT